MLKDSGQYKLFFKFKKAYSLAGFKCIDRGDSLILTLEEMMDENNQYLSVFDMLNMKTLFVSQGIIKILGVKPEDLTSYHFKEATHPDDLKRQELGLLQLFKITHELFVAKKGEMVISSTIMMRSPGGNYINQLLQGYLFFSLLPIETVYMIHINTDISWYKKNKNNFHYYIGNDMSNFRFPDDNLLRVSHSFSDREFEIIKLIHAGLESVQIANKLFLSKYTVNTHRKNILKKSGKDNISELIFYLENIGLL